MIHYNEKQFDRKYWDDSTVLDYSDIKFIGIDPTRRSAKVYKV